MSVSKRIRMRIVTRSITRTSTRSNQPLTHVLARVRKMCLALPGAIEVEAWGEPTFRVKKLFAMYASKNNHHGNGRNALWLKATPANQALMIEMRPDRFFKPPYVGPSGWVGVWIDRDTDWKELASLVEDAWRQIAPRKLLLQRLSRD